MRTQNITGLVLAGGQGQRMGGQDKGLLNVGGRPLVAHVLARLSPQVADIIISANRHHACYAGFGPRVVSDVIPDYPGPLAGILAGLKEATTPWVLVVPCDSPFLPADLAERLLAASDDPACIRMVGTPDGDQPVFALIPRSLAGALEAFLAAGERRTLAWYRQHGLCRVKYQEDHPFMNVNTPEDRLRAEAQLHA
ncbi:MAG: molybdenum cofactor guanylyltransferase [Gammaproteobacteria bacterium]|nr:molybdenum cofactor guanylyltransferase [Gammaproteobacteria bacterium]